MGELRHFPRRPLTPEEAQRATESLLATPISERGEKARALFLDDPDTVIPLLKMLEDRLEGNPAGVLEDAEFLYRFLEGLGADGRDELYLFDERAYFMGEAARIAATACRQTSRREEARRWIDRSEANYRSTLNCEPNLARLAYQRLALYTEERRFEEVLELVPPLVESFKTHRMAAEALKCRFLEGIVHWENGQLREALEVFQGARREAQELGNEALDAKATTNVARLYALLGETAEALAYSKTALPLLQRLGYRVGIAKLRWGMGDLLRTQGKLPDAIGAYRGALQEAREVGMRGDVAALHLIVADLLLEVGEDRQAAWEIQAALPIIDEEKMVSEGLAALSLLRQSLRNNRINRQALRELHGFFQDLGS